MSELVRLKPQLVEKASGERGPRPEHEWSGPRLRFEQASGEWGEFVDLQGPRGDDAPRPVAWSFEIARNQFGVIVEVIARPIPFSTPI